MANSFYYNGNLYARRSEADQWKGFIGASALSWGVYKTLPLFGIPFQKQIQQELPNNSHYKNNIAKALEISGLGKKGVTINEAQYDSFANIDYKLGLNAEYNPKAGRITINTDRMAASTYHELGHALNHLKGKLPFLLQKMRYPGYAIAGLMEYFAIFSRTKPKEAKRNFADVVEDNCGKIAFAAMLPMVAEEALASHRGIKLARKTGLAEPLINNLKRLYNKALLTYGARAVLGGLAVYGSRKIMDYYTRPQKIDSDIYNIFG